MAALAWRLMSASRDARLQSALPVAAIAMATVLLLLTVGAWLGFDRRAERSAWRTPQPADDPVAVQALRTDYLAGRPITIVDLAALHDDAPVPPGMDHMPEPGELWVSPALARALDTMPADQLADRFAGARPHPGVPARRLAGARPHPAAGELDAGSLLHPDELVAIVGLAAADPAMSAAPRPRPRDDGATAAPTGIAAWSTTPDQQSQLYILLARVGAALMAVPLLALAGSAARLVAARRNRRLAQLRLIGGSVGQVVGLTAAEAGALGACGALLGGVGYLAALPLAARIPMAGGGWFVADLWVGMATLAGILVAITALVTASAVVSLLPVVRRPFATARAARPGMARVWRLAVLAAAVGVYWSNSDGGLRLLAIPLGLVLLSLMVAGPWAMRILGTVLARSARTAPGLLAGRRLIGDPRAGWRAVAGMVLAAFVAAYLAVAAPGDIAESMLGGPSNRLRLVVAAAQADTVAGEARGRLAGAGVDADVVVDERPPWAPATDRSLWITVPGDGSELERARTAVAGLVPGRVATTPVDDVRSDVTVIDDVRVGAIAVLVSAFLVAAVSAGVGGIGWVLDQQGTLTLVRLAGAPVRALAAARRREVVAPLALCAGGAAVLGAGLGMLTTASTGMGPDGRWLWVFTSLAVAGVLAVLGADLLSRPLLQRATSDLADRE